MIRVAAVMAWLRRLFRRLQPGRRPHAQGTHAEPATQSAHTPHTVTLAAHRSGPPAAHTLDAACDRRWRDDRLRVRRRNQGLSAALASRLRRQGPAWAHAVVALDGPDDNPYNPHTVAAARAFTRWLLGDVPAVCKLERSCREGPGGLHLHLVVPAGTPAMSRTRWTHVTADGVIVRGRRCGLYEVQTAPDHLERLLYYLHKPAHAGWSWFRATGALPAPYRAAQDALRTGVAMSRALGLTRLRPTLWIQGLPVSGAGAGDRPARPQAAPADPAGAPIGRSVPSPAARRHAPPTPPTLPPVPSPAPSRADRSSAAQPSPAEPRRPQRPGPWATPRPAISSRQVVRVHAQQDSGSSARSRRTWSAAPLTWWVRMLRHLARRFGFP